MELGAHEKGMAGKLDDFNEISFGVYARKHKAFFLEDFPVVVVYFVAVAVALHNFFFAVCFRGFGAGLYKTAVFAEAH